MKENNDDSLLIKKDSLKELIGKYHKTQAVKDIEEAAKNSSVVELSLSSLTLFPLMNESNYSDNDLKDVLSLATLKGIDIPIFLYSYENRPTIVNGVKRFLCAKKLKMSTIKAIYLNGSLDMVISYVIENLLMDNSNGLVMAYAYKSLIENFGFKEKDICDISGLSHGQVNNMLRLNNLSSYPKDLLLKGYLTSAKARLLVAFDEKTQMRLSDKFISLSVRQCEELARKEHNPTGQQKSSLSYKREDNRIVIQSDSEKELDEIESYLKSKLEVNI